jgi:hypothetical protein
MPRINVDIQNSVIYLYRSVEDVLEGKCAGGSGFVIALNSGDESERLYLYAFTNSRTIKSGYPVIRVDSITQQIYPLEKGAKDWIHHPNGEDVAACLLGWTSDYPHISYYRLEHFLTNELMEQSGIGVGSDLFLMGRHITSRDVQCHTPMARFGKLTMIDRKLVGQRKVQDRECLRATVFVPGEHSGAPVFVQPADVLSRETIQDSERITVPWLLGMDQGQIRRYEPVINAQGEFHPRRWKVRSPYSVIAVVPAWSLRELLETSELLGPKRELGLKAGLEQERLTSERWKAQGISKAEYLKALKLISHRIASEIPATEEKSSGYLVRAQTENELTYSIEDFKRDFPDETACLNWLKGYLYPDGIYCRKCQGTIPHAKIVGRRSYSCARCGNHVHPTVGTIYHNSRKPLHLWFEAIYRITSTADQTTPTQLEEELRVNYKTASRMWKTIREMLTRKEA